MLTQGIYKITSPSGRIYIGQSININKRFKRYKQLDCKSQLILYKSLIKYGYSNHTFEVIELCNEDQLNERERYFQDVYDVTGSNGLNCQLTTTNTKSGKHSEETKNKMSSSHTGKKHTEETKNKMRVACVGRRPSKKAIDKASIANKGNTYNLGRVASEDTKKKISISKSKVVICTVTNKTFIGVRAAAEFLEIPRATLKGKLNGNANNNTSMVYL